MDEVISKLNDFKKNRFVQNLKPYSSKRGRINRKRVYVCQHICQKDKISFVTDNLNVKANDILTFAELEDLFAEQNLVETDKTPMTPARSGKISFVDDDRYNDEREEIIRNIDRIRQSMTKVKGSKGGFKSTEIARMLKLFGIKDKGNKDDKIKALLDYLETV